MDLTFDVIIIGEGLAGFSAAVALTRRGKRVAVISQTGGATSVSSGSWDFGPITSFTSFENLRKSERWKKLHGEILIDGASTLFDNDEVVSLSRELSAVLNDDLKMHFVFHRPFLLPTSSGHWKATFGAQKIQTLCDRDEIKNRRIGFVYDRSWRLQGALIAKKLVTESEKRGSTLDVKALEIESGLRGNDWPLPHVATRLVQDQAFQESLKNGIKKALLQSDRDFLIFPPLFLKPPFLDSLARDIGVGMGECLSTVEPVAGFRLNRAIHNSLKRISVSLLRVSQIQVEKSSDRIERLKILTREQNAWTSVSASSYVLATGKYFGGGVHMGYQKFSEPMFDLPLFYSREGAPIQLRREMPWETEGEFQKEQQWEKVGVWLSKDWMPRGSSNEPIYKNLVACGSIIGGIDFARANMGLGFMAYSGRQSGITISQMGS